MEPIAPAWLLTVLFLGVGGWSLIEAAQPRSRGAGRVGCLWHALMSAAMIAMLWPWGESIPAMTWTVVFGIGAARFAALAVSRRSTGSAGVTTGWCHAVTFASMVVMAWAMELMEHGSPAATDADVARSAVVATAGGHHHSGMATTGGAAAGLGSIQLWCLANAVILLCVGAFLIVGFVNDSRRSSAMTGMVRASGGATWTTSAAPTTVVAGVVGPDVVTVPARAPVRLLANVAMIGGMAVAFLQMA